jgi:hypothetical protein
MGNTIGLIEKYLQPVYVETGCSAGDGIFKAHEAGIRKLYGIEPNNKMYEALLRRTEKMDFTLLRGTSEEHMNRVVQEIDVLEQRAIFFLDAHKVGCCENESYPLVYELMTICKSIHRDHVIMIDDVMLFGNELPDDKQKVIDMLRTINRKYKIEYEHSETNRNDVMVAYI